MASTIAATLAHTYHLKTCPSQAGARGRQAAVTPAPRCSWPCPSVHCRGQHLTRSRGEAPVGEDRAVAHPFRQRPQLAPPTVGPGSVTRLAAAAHGSQENQRTPFEGGGLSIHICIWTYCLASTLIYGHDPSKGSSNLSALREKEALGIDQRNQLREVHVAPNLYSFVFSGLHTGRMSFVHRSFDSQRLRHQRVAPCTSAVYTG